MEDHSRLFNEINGFSQRKLKKVETKTTSASGDNVVEKRGAKGLTAAVQSAAEKSDLQVGLIVPGLMIGEYDNTSIDCMIQNKCSLSTDLRRTVNDVIPPKIILTLCALFGDIALPPLLLFTQVRKMWPMTRKHSKNTESLTY